MAATGSGDEELTRRERREQYERILSIVDANSGGKQRPMAALSTVRTIAGYVDIAPGHVNKRIRVGVSRGDLLREGDRVCLADREEVLERIDNADDVDHLRTLVQAEASGPSRSDVIAAINDRTDEVDDAE